MTERLITLPDRDEMANRLVAFDGSGHMVRNFYPRLLREAGTSVPVMGYVMIMSLAVADYVDGSGMDSLHSRSVQITLAMRLHEIARVLIDDQELLDQVLDLYQVAGLTTGREKKS